MTSDTTDDIADAKGLLPSEEDSLGAEERKTRVTDQQPVMYYTCRTNDTYSINYISELSREILGYSPEQFTTGEIRFSDLIHPDDFDQFALDLDQALAERRPFHITYRIRHISGKWRWVEGQGVGIFVGGELQFIQGFIVDVTRKRRKAKEDEILSRLSLDMAAVENMDELGQAVLAAINGIWQWDAFFFSVRQSGTARIRIILEADTFDGEKKFGSNRMGVFTEKLRRRNPSLELREPGTSMETVTRFGDLSRPSLSLMFAPLIIKNRHIGMLSVQSYDPYLYDEAALALLQKVSQYVAPTVERVRADERSRAFSQLGEELNAAATPRQAALLIVRFADELIGWDACGVEQFSAQENLMYDVIGFDIIDGVRTQLPVRQEPLKLSGYNLEARNKGSVLITRESSPDLKPEHNSFGDANRASASMMFVAMRSSSGIIGFIGLHSYTVNAYDMEDVKVLQALGDLCSSAMERTWAQQNLRTREEIYRIAISAAGAVPYQLDYGTNSYVFVGEGIEAITGWPAEEFTTPKWKTMVQEVVVHGGTEEQTLQEIAQDVRGKKRTNWKADIRFKTRSGNDRWVLDTSVEMPGLNGILGGALGILQDITERKEHEKALLYDSMHDSLTGLANRALLLDHLRLALHRAHRRESYSFAVLFLDIDRFKQINDSLGHLVGDKLLIAVAQSLQASIRPGDTAARFAGDEFVLLLDDIHRLEDVLPVAKRILYDLKQPITLEGKEVFTSASMGIAISSQSYQQAEDLLRDADNALYRAKNRGKGRYEIFDVDMYEQALKALELENGFRGALAASEFLLHYQPIVDVKTGRIIKFEALVRWNHPTRGMVPPGDFIPMAEETGLINSLGLWVMEESADQLRRWHDDLPQTPLLVMSVNLSIRQFGDEDLADRLFDIVKSRNLNPENFVLEITETVFLEKQSTAMRLLNRLKEIGFSLALDDFGTGYSSLSNLLGFHVDWIKIDRSFTSKLELPGSELEIVRAIVQLGNSLGIGVTVEGVETNGQLAILRDMDCRHVQGFYLSRPLSSEDATAILVSSQNGSFGSTHL